MRDGRHHDDGFGLTEIMISMLLLAILMMAMLPLLINSFQIAAKNTTIAAANQLVTQRLEDARAAAATGDCAHVAAVLGETLEVKDGRGARLEVSGSLACTQDATDPRNNPTLARATVKVETSVSGFQNPVAAATTDIYVKFQP